MNNQEPNGKPQPNVDGRGSKRKTTAADDGKPGARKNKEKVTQREEEPEEVVVVEEARSKSTRVSNGLKAGPSDSSPAVGHPAAERADAAAKSSGAASGNLCHPLGKDQMKWLSAQLQAIVEANQDFPQKLKQRLISESSRVENPFKFIVALFNEGVLCDGSRDLEAHFGFKEMLVQLAVTIGCSKGPDGTGGLVKALESSGNFQLLSALHTWAKEDLGIETDDDDGPIVREPEGGTSALQSPSRKRLRRDEASPTRLRSSGTKRRSKIAAHMEEDGSMEQLEVHSVSKACARSEPHAPVKKVTRSSGELVASNAIVLREILGHFPHSELLQLSLVTKLWKEAARSVMLERGNITARLTCDEHRPTCIDLEGFAAVLSTMKTVPFSIIQIKIDGGKSCRTRAQDPRGSIDTILAKLAVKKASVKLGGFLWGDWCENKDCTGVLLAKKLLQDLGGTLEELTLQGYPDKCTAGQNLMEQMAENWSFPRLNILKLGDFYLAGPPDRYYNYLRALLSLAPNLVTLDTKGSLKFDETILGSNSTVQWLFRDEVEYPWKKIPKNLIANIRFVDLELPSYIFTSTFDFDEFNWKMPRLLRTCYAATLRAVRLDAKFAVPFMTYKICFHNVSDLHMELDFRNLQRYQPAVLEMVKNFDFTSIFPTLTAVEVSNGYQDDFGPLPESFQRFLEETHLEEARSNRADNIKKMQLDDDLGLAKASAQFFAQMFPCVQDLVFLSGEGQSDIDLIGKNWPGLKHLSFSFTDRGNTNLDSIFCGLHKKEVAVLRTKTEKYLKTVEIVPVKSGITCMKIK